MRNIELDAALVQRLDQVWQSIIFDGKSLTCTKYISEMPFVSFLLVGTRIVSRLCDTAIIELLVGLEVTARIDAWKPRTRL